MASINITKLCLHTKWKAKVTCNFSYLIENEGRFKVTGSHLQCKNGDILEMVQDRDVVQRITNSK